MTWGFPEIRDTNWGGGPMVRIITFGDRVLLFWDHSIFRTKISWKPQGKGIQILSYIGNNGKENGNYYSILGITLRYYTYWGLVGNKGM